MSPHEGGRLEPASSPLLEDIAIEARATRVQDHVRVNLPMRMVPFLHSQRYTIKAAGVVFKHAYPIPMSSQVSGLKVGFDICP